MLRKGTVIRRENFIPALRYHWLTRLYDPLMRALMRDHLVKLPLVEQAGIGNNDRVLDLGCGTATLSVLVKQVHPHARITGVDADPKVLAIATRKIRAAGVDVRLLRGMANRTELPVDSFDRVLSSLLFHHLRSDAKLSTLEEVYRILRPGDELHIADFGKPADFLMRSSFLLVQTLDGFASTSDSAAGNLPVYMTQAGFVDVSCTQVVNTLFGSISFYRSQKQLRRES